MLTIKNTQKFVLNLKTLVAAILQPELLSSPALNLVSLHALDGGVAQSSFSFFSFPASFFSFFPPSFYS